MCVCACVDACGASLMTCSPVLLVVVLMLVCRPLHVLNAADLGDHQLSPNCLWLGNEGTESQRKA